MRCLEGIAREIEPVKKSYWSEVSTIVSWEMSLQKKSMRNS